MEYDIEKNMDQEVRETMSKRVAEASQDFYDHQEKTQVLLAQGQQTNDNSLAL
jgi:hypothetical protein